MDPLQCSKRNNNIVGFDGIIIIIVYLKYSMYYNYCHLFYYAWWLCMAINIILSVQYSGGLLPDIVLLTQGYYNTIEELVQIPACRGFVFTAYETVYY